jgi:hypothetical protein
MHFRFYMVDESEAESEAVSLVFGTLQKPAPNCRFAQGLGFIPPVGLSFPILRVRGAFEEQFPEITQRLTT